VAARAAARGRAGLAVATARGQPTASAYLYQKSRFPASRLFLSYALVDQWLQRKPADARTRDQSPVRSRFFPLGKLGTRPTIVFCIPQSGPPRESHTAAHTDLRCYRASSSAISPTTTASPPIPASAAYGANMPEQKSSSGTGGQRDIFVDICHSVKRQHPNVE
jgi:hypothetical protein